MTLPNLIGCGAGKSGTTSLYYYLSQHPQIYMAAAKEVHFFSRHFGEGVPWYESHFVGGSNVPVVGEFSTSYMLDTVVPERMANLIPNARLLFIFRNPIDRAYSNYWFSVSIGTQDRQQSFSDVIRTRLGFEKYIEGGLYYSHLSRFLRYFPPEQIHVMITEEFKRHPIQQMALCYNFLGIEKTFEPDINQKYNVTVTTQNRWLGSSYAIWGKAKQHIKPFFKGFPIGWRSTLAQLEKQAVQQLMSDKRPPMPEADRTFLAEIFGPQNEKLIEFIGRELPHWH
jgi:hypothetical protein